MIGLDIRNALVTQLDDYNARATWLPEFSLEEGDLDQLVTSVALRDADNEFGTRQTDADEYTLDIAVQRKLTASGLADRVAEIDALIETADEIKNLWSDGGALRHKELGNASPTAAPTWQTFTNIEHLKLNVFTAVLRLTYQPADADD
jgi:hypothetical protein